MSGGRGGTVDGSMGARTCCDATRPHTHTEAVDLQLGGRRAIVTGASRGIGLSIAHSLAAEGVSVALVARETRALSAAPESVAQHGSSVLAVPADTRDDRAVRSMVARVVTDLGGVDILVNAAARPGG